MDKTERKITKIAREVNNLVLKEMKKENIGSGEFELIHYIRHNPGSTAKQACEKLNMDKGAVARRVSSLEKKGYLIRETCDNDKRSQILYSTEKANNLKQSKTVIEANFYEWLISDLSQEELHNFVNVLDKLYIKTKNERKNGFSSLLENDECEKEIKK